MGTLYLVSTPIGNLKDITFRAIEILSQAEIIACEDTRKTGLLLKNLAIPFQGKLLSYYEENESKKISQIITFLKNNQKVALVSNAGTPALSDPGFKLIRECLNQKIKVEPIPGPSAVLTALIASGLPTDKFLFLGFLPKKPGRREKILNQLAQVKKMIKLTTIVFLSPHRLIKELEAVKKVFGEVEIALGRELTKIHEEIRKEKISQAINYFKKNKAKGEFTLVF